MIDFGRLADQWDDPQGAFSALHAINPIRLDWILNNVAARKNLNRDHEKPLKGMRVVDVGCGGGLLCEPLARLGANVLGVDASENTLDRARERARRQRLEIEYRAGDATSIDERDFDVALAMEVIEHVNEPSTFVGETAALLAPDGLLFGSTLNRTMRSLALGIVVAEEILGWTPRGAHRWEQFVTPEEFAAMMRAADVAPLGRRGIVYDLLRRRWTESDDVGVNYMIFGVKTR